MKIIRIITNWATSYWAKLPEDSLIPAIIVWCGIFGFAVLMSFWFYISCKQPATVEDRTVIHIANLSWSNVSTTIAPEILDKRDIVKAWNVNGLDNSLSPRQIWLVQTSRETDLVLDKQDFEGDLIATYSLGLDTYPKTTNIQSVAIATDTTGISWCRIVEGDKTIRYLQVNEIDNIDNDDWEVSVL